MSAIFVLLKFYENIDNLSMNIFLKTIIKEIKLSNKQFIIFKLVNMSIIYSVFTFFNAY